MNRRVLLVGLAITVPVVLILFFNLGRDPHQVKSPLIGRSAPTFALKEVGSNRLLSLESFRGKPVVINFWATWCVPCYAEHPVLVQTASRSGANVQFLGVVYQDTEDKIQEFLRQNGTAYPALVDDSGKTAIAYGVYGVPETFFVDPAGTIVAKHVGPLTFESMSKNLRKAGL